jgi:hypothetical protein
MLPSPRRPLAFVAGLVIVASLNSVQLVWAAAAPATFVSPVPGLTTVTNTTSYQVSWTIATGLVVNGESITIQTSRPLGLSGCDIRWVPVRSAAVSGTSYQADGLLPNRCYRFLLVLSTSSGQQIVTSPTLISSSSGLGPVADFTLPYLDGIVAYDTSQKIGWAERDTFGSRITYRAAFEQTAPAIDGACAGVTWSSWNALTMTGTSTWRTVQRSYCYRYKVILQDAVGFRSEDISGAMPIAAALPGWLGTLNFYRAGVFATQATNTWCVAASSQMMLNIILDQTDTSSASQSTYITYGQANDGGYYPAGTNPAGWSAILDRYGGSSYSVQSFGDSTSALKRAATRIRQTNKPVGMLVWSGRHAWVMNGFTATNDPAVTSDFTITGVYVSGPLYPRPANSLGYDPAPNTFYTTAQLSKYFLTYTDTIVKTWNGKYVLIVP